MRCITLYVILNFFALACVGLTVNVHGYGLRLSYVIMGFLFIFFAPLFFDYFFSFFNKVNVITRIVVIVFLLHPIIIYTLLKTGIRENLRVVAPRYAFISGFSWFMSGFILIIVYSSWSKKQYERFFKILYNSILILAIESLILFYMLRGKYLSEYYLNPNSGGFSSLLKLGDALIARLAFIFIFLSLYYYLVKASKKRYLTGMFAGILLLISTVNKSGFLGFIIFFPMTIILLLTRNFPRERPERFIIKLLYVVLIFLILSFFSYKIIVSKRQPEHFFTTFWTRTVTWSRSIAVGMKFLPLGVGGGLGNIYNTSFLPNLGLTDKIIEIFGDPYGAQTYVQKEFFTRFYEKRRSIHSLQIDIFVCYGVIGLYIIFFSFYIPLRYILIALFKLKPFNWSNKTQGLFVISMMLLGFQVISATTSSSNNLVWLMGIFYLFLIRFNDLSSKV